MKGGYTELKQWEGGAPKRPVRVLVPVRKNGPLSEAVAWRRRREE